YVLKALTPDDIRQVLARALTDRAGGLGDRRITAAPEALDLLAQAADGDARRALNLLEMAADLAATGTEPATLTVEQVREVAAGGARRFDKHGEAFYDQISALHKSVRGSDPDAALYWLARMLDGGCDPLYVARRVVRMATEDIGNADPRELAIAQAVVYLAAAPKSNAVYLAFGEAMADAKSSGSLDVPLHLRNAPTRLMKELGYGTGYRYAHDEADAYAPGVQYFPDGMERRTYYRPAPRGLEERIAARLAEQRQRDEAARVSSSDKPKK